MNMGIKNEDINKINGPINFHPCNCENWRKFSPILEAQQWFATNHNLSFVEEYPAEGVFLYCPWCGKKRKQTI